MSGDHFNSSADETYNHSAAGGGGFASGERLGFGQKALEVKDKLNGRSGHSSSNQGTGSNYDTASDSREKFDSNFGNLRNESTTTRLDRGSTGSSERDSRNDSNLSESGTRSNISSQNPRSGEDTVNIRDFDSTNRGFSSESSAQKFGDSKSGYASGTTIGSRSDVPYDRENLVESDSFSRDPSFDQFTSGVESGNGGNVEVGPSGGNDRYGARSGIGRGDNGGDYESYIKGDNRSDQSGITSDTTSGRDINYGRDAAIGLGGIGAGTSTFDRNSSSTRNQDSNIPDYDNSRSINAVSDIKSVNDVQTGLKELKVKNTDSKGFTDLTGGSGLPSGTGLTGKIKGGGRDGESSIAETEFNRSERDEEGRELDSYGKPYTL